MKIIRTLVLFILFLIFSPQPIKSAVMQSAQYKIQTDSVNVGGLDSSASGSYKMRDTVGEVGTGDLTGTAYKLRSGYQPMLEIYLAITSPADIEMLPAIPGVSGGTGDGNVEWSVTTDNLAGYLLKAKASTNPSLQSGSYSFANYTPADADPDYSWSVAAANSEFGFSPEGDDIVQKFKDDEVSCNTGVLDTPDKCWYNLGTADENIASTASSNHPSGMATTIKFRATSGASHLQEEGVYSATITVTAVAQ